jgi:hypothetical protein
MVCIGKGYFNFASAPGIKIVSEEDTVCQEALMRSPLLRDIAIAATVCVLGVIAASLLFDVTAASFADGLGSHLQSPRLLAKTGGETVLAGLGSPV